MKEARRENVSYGQYALAAPFECANCKRMSVVNWASRDEYESEPSRTSVQKWYPAFVEGQEFPDVPEHIAKAASEAYGCHSIGAYRGSVAIARSVLEASCKAMDATASRLVGMIDELEERRLLRPTVKDAAHEIRHLGNDVAHGDYVEAVQAEESEEILGLMSEVLRELFQSPAEVERRKQARLAKKSGD